MGRLGEIIIHRLAIVKKEHQTLLKVSMTLNPEKVAGFLERAISHLTFYVSMLV